MAAYYNEIDLQKAAWLRELIAAGAIAAGDVDTRSIVDVRPDDLEPYTQVHLCAGVGVWSYALRHAGWPDDRPVWTASFPCQPFSAAGKGLGHEDERHLWPVGFGLIRQRRPVALFGEQVASADGLAWLDVVSTDLEAEGYTFGTADTCAAGLGAPHIRQRLFFVADASGNRAWQHARELSGHEGQHEEWAARCRDASIARGAACGVAYAERDGRRTDLALGCAQGRVADGRDCEDGELADAESGGRGIERHALVAWRSGHADGTLEPCLVGDAERARLEGHCGDGDDGHRSGRVGADPARSIAATGFAGAVGGYWDSADWILCRDPDGAKWRPVERGAFPLAHGATARVGRLRGYGDAINAEVAIAFIAAYLDVKEAA